MAEEAAADDAKPVKADSTKDEPEKAGPEQAPIDILAGLVECAGKFEIAYSTASFTSITIHIFYH